MQALEAKSSTELAFQEIEEWGLKLPQVDCPVTHRFGPGIYIREVEMPAGSLVVGHEHIHAHANVMLQGRGILLVDGLRMEVKAPFFYNAGPGRKVALWMETAVWWNIYPSEETDPEKLEDLLLNKSPVFLNDIEGIAEMTRVDDVYDYEQMRKEMLLTDTAIQGFFAEGGIAPPLPETITLQTGPSQIHGTGLFATAPYQVSDEIGTVLSNNAWTMLGKHINHAKEPNATPVLLHSGDIVLRAIQAIKGNQGGRLGDEITVDYRALLSMR